MSVLDQAALEAHQFEIAIAIRKDTAPGLWVEFEKSFVRTFSRTWRKVARTGAATVQWDGLTRSAAVARHITEQIVAPLLTWLDDDQFLESTVPMLYEALATQFLRDFEIGKAVARGKGIKLTAELSRRDRRAIEAIKSLTQQAAGRLFPADVADKVATVVNRVVLEEGFEPKVAAAQLQAEVEGALGLGAGSVVPTQFATNPEAYFEVLANNASLLSTNVGRVVAMSDAGVEAYEIVAVRDSRTSVICLAMNGRIIGVNAGVRMVDALLDAATPDELAAKFPWNSRRTAQELGPNTPSNNARLADSGLGFPPYHGRCRSTVIPVV